MGGYSGQVSVLDLKNRTMTCWNLQSNAFGTTVSEDGRRVYLTATPNGTVRNGTGFGVLTAAYFGLARNLGGVIHIYDAQNVYDRPFAKTPTCSAAVRSDGPELGGIRWATCRSRWPRWTVPLIWRVMATADRDGAT